MYIPSADTWVVIENDKTVGFTALIGNEVGGLFVDPSFHGRGLGNALMDKARELHSTLEVEVFKENSIGRRFYDRYGFKLHEETGCLTLRLSFTE